MSKPGVMIYFNEARVVDKLTDQEAGELFRGILQYAERGEIPDFAAGSSALGLLWVHFQQSIDADSDRYARVAKKNRYSRYCGTERAAGRAPLTFDDWCEQILNERQRSSTNVNERQRTSTIVNDRDQYQIPNTNLQIPDIKYQTSNSNKKEDVCGEKKKAIREGISFLPAGDRDLDLVLEQPIDAIRQAAQEAKDKGLQGYAGWLYLTGKLLFG